MAFTIQLDPEMERRLAEQARTRGVSIETYVQQILERHAAVERSNQKLTAEEFEAALDAMTAYSDKIPVLSLEAFRRDEIYRDHDLIDAPFYSPIGMSPENSLRQHGRVMYPRDPSTTRRALRSVASLRTTDRNCVAGLRRSRVKAKCAARRLDQSDEPGLPIPQ